jgi:hypothetical protein
LRVVHFLQLDTHIHPRDAQLDVFLMSVVGSTLDWSFPPLFGVTSDEASNCRSTSLSCASRLVQGCELDAIRSCKKIFKRWVLEVVEQTRQTLFMQKMKRLKFTNKAYYLFKKGTEAWPLPLTESRKLSDKTH